MKNLKAQLKQAPPLVGALFVGWLLIMLLVPFHALISTWGGTTIGPLAVWKAWKEAVLLLLGVGAAAQCFLDRSLARALWRSWLTKVIIGYVFLHLLVAAVVGNQFGPLVFGLAINLRIVAFFLVSQIIFYYIKPSSRDILLAVLIPAGMVVVFGLLQIFLLPYNFLAWFGYQTNVTIAPFNTIDQQLDQLRIMSTLRGPNPLGAYLILPGVLLVWLIVLFLQKYKTKKITSLTGHVLLQVLACGGLLVVLYSSHSRSAWLGFVVAAASFVLLVIRKKWRIILLLGGVACVMMTGVAVYELRTTSFVQNVILHDNPNIGPEETSNKGHTDSLKNALSDISKRPLQGCGPGCAGPASFYDPDGTRLAENYYLQVGQEVGVLGIILFVTFIILVAYQLYVQRADPLALVMFSTLAGLSLANLLLHVWADDTLAYVWWGACAVVLARKGTSTSKV